MVYTIFIKVHITHLITTLYTNSIIVNVTPYLLGVKGLTSCQCCKMNIIDLYKEIIIKI